MKFLLFGTGDYYNRYKKWFEQQNVLALLDNSKQKEHTIIDGIEVLLPEEGIKLNYDIVVILSFYVEQMKQQLISLGVSRNKIFHFYDLHQLLKSDAVSRPVQYFLNAKEIIERGKYKKTKILLLSHDLISGGPEMALFHAAEILKKNGYEVVFASMLDGPLKEELMENEIPVIVDENIQISTMQETEWVNTFSMIICNTLNFYVFLSERSTSVPVIWWLHDARFFYDGVNRQVIKKICLNNLKIVTVGFVPAQAVKEFLPDMSCKELLYGVQAENVICTERVKREKIRFVTIGFLEDIKGQDVLIQAIKKLPDNILHQCEFFIVGYNKTLFGEMIRKESENISEIVFTGNVSHEEIYKLLDASEVLICPSRQDSMPTVAAEAMMHSVPCIVSDITGTAAFIQDGRDGFIFPSGNEKMLAEKIKWCVLNIDKLRGIGQEAKKLYEEFFSMGAFEKNFLEIVNEVLKNKR